MSEGDVMNDLALLTEFDKIERQIHNCTLCTLCTKRNRAVPGNGSRTADVMFIGEGPGYYEDQQGLPFVGRAGRLLNEMLETIGMKREDVYVTNMIKCRAPNNRDPLPIEINACAPYLDKQIQMISPKIIVTLGRYSTGKFFPDVPIGELRGKPSTWNGMTIYPMYHPAAALRNSNLRAALERDFQNLPTLLHEAPPPAPTQPQPEIQQLGLMDAPTPEPEREAVEDVATERPEDTPEEPKQLGMF